MNLLAVDIGNTNITLALFMDGDEKLAESISGEDQGKLADFFVRAWDMVPIVERSKEKRREAVIVVSSVKPAWTKVVSAIAKDKLSEKIYLIGKDIPLPMEMWVDDPKKVGTDRVVSAAAAYAVVEDAVIVADFGTAITIDLVNENGIFLGGVICPGFDISAKALKDNTALLPKVKVTRPAEPFGKNTKEAINAGLYFMAVGLLRDIVERYAEKVGKWPHTVITGAAAKVIKDDCDFVDSFVTDLPIKGILLTYQKYIEEKD